MAGALAIGTRPLAAAIESNPRQDVTVDLEKNEVRCGSLAFPCQMQPGARQALVTGNWDFLGQLVEAGDQIRATADRLPYLNQFARA